MINQIHDIMKIILSPKIKKNYIVTIAIGDQYLSEWEQYALPSWKLYCEKYDIGLIVFTRDLISKQDLKWKKATWQKLLIGNTLKSKISNIDNICYLDTDILISPIAPDIFNNFNMYILIYIFIFFDVYIRIIYKKLFPVSSFFVQIL